MASYRFITFKSVRLPVCPRRRHPPACGRSNSSRPPSRLRRVVPGVHHRSAGESDALEFEYHTRDYAVRTFHSMDRLVVILRPLEGAPQGAPEAIARLLFRDSAPIKLVREQTKDGVTIGRQHAEADPPQPWIDSMVWWSGNGETGFAVEKAVALEPGNEPSTAGFSSQQVWMWFDTFGSRRRAP